VAITERRYGSLEEGQARYESKGRMTASTRRVAGALGLLCVVAVVGLTAMGAGSGGDSSAARSELLRVAKPANDFTASSDKAAYNAYFSQLTAKEESKHVKDLERDARASGSAAAATANIGSYFLHIAQAIAGEKHASKSKLAKLAGAKTTEAGPPAEVAKEAGPVAAEVYKSADAARDDLDSFFDSMPTGKKASHLTAAEADKQLMDIFPSTGKDAAPKRTSARQAQSDLDSYFDSMPTHMRRKERATPSAEVDQDIGLDGDAEPANGGKRWSSQSSKVRDYIEGKRKAIEKGGGFTQVTNDGSVVKQSKVWSSDNARKAMDGYWNSMNGATRKQMEESAKKNGDIKMYEKLHPGYKKALDMAHKEWAASHNGRPPQTPEEIKEYGKLVQSEDIHKDDPGHVVMEAYLRQHPEVKAKMKKVHDEWYAKHSKPPTTEAEKDAYKALVTEYVGHLDIDSKKVMAKEHAHDAPAGATEHVGTKQALLKEYMASHPELRKKLDKVHAEWKKHHAALPQGAEEKAEYDALMKKYVGDLHITTASAKGHGTMSLAKADDDVNSAARQNAMKAYLEAHKDIQAKVEKVHTIWRKTHR